MLEEILVVSCIVDWPADVSSTGITVRFRGHRLGTGARTQAADQFVHDELVGPLEAGCGPLSVTARIRGVNAGEWDVSAIVLASEGRTGSARRATRVAATIAPPVSWSWHPRGLRPAPKGPLRTSLAPFARVPGIIPFAWLAMVVLGIAVALVTLGFTTAAADVRGPVVPVAVLAVLIGAIAAKGWYVVVQQPSKRADGWCIQGFVAGAAAVVAVVSALGWIAFGPFLDAAAPGLLFGMALGRVGCFFAGCCAGRPTAKRWGVWSSDRRLGLRRVPTQLTEGLLALTLALAALQILLTWGTAHGGIFFGSLAVYTVVRQLILRLRAEPRRTTLGVPLTAAAAVVLFTTDIAVHVTGVMHVGGA